MEAMNELAASQERMGKEITRMLANMRKDSPSVKTEQYFSKRSVNLEKLWEEVQFTHQKMLDLNIPSHNYFQIKYLDQIQRCYEEASKYIIENRTKTQGLSSLQIPANPACQPESANRLKEQEVRIRQLSQALAQIENELTSGHSRRRYEMMLEKINYQWKAIRDLNIELQVQGIADAIQLCTNVEEKFETIAVQLSEMIDVTPNQIQSSRVTTEGRGITLPQIKLPIFDGKYEEWPTFNDIFTKVIHLNTTLTNTEKMQYLKTNVRGEASRAIQHFQITDSNYEAALDILQTRYSNNRLLLSKLLDRMLDLPAVHQATTTRIKNLHDTAIECLKAISNMGIKTDEWGPLIMRIITRKWDDETNRLYEQSLRNPHELQEWTEFLIFLQTRYQSLETLSRPHNKNTTEEGYQRHKESCAYCNGFHTIFACSKFRALPAPARGQAIRAKRLCPKCLKHHAVGNCQATQGCHSCRGPHHTLIHEIRDTRSTRGTQITYRTERPTTTETRNTRGTQDIHRTERPTTMAAHINERNQTVLLATALVLARTASGTQEYIRALIDPGSQAAFITEEAATRLANPRQKVRAEVSGLGAGDTKIAKCKINAELSPRFPSEFRMNISCLVMPKLTKALPDQKLNIREEDWQNLTLADPTFKTPGPIDMIIGAKEYSQIVLQGLQKYTSGLLGQKTEFGWTLSGDVTYSNKEEIKVISMVSAVDEKDQLHKFWELEEVSMPRQLTDDEARCEEHFSTHTKRNQDGTYTVRIPFKDTQELGQSRSRATARFIQLEKRLAKNKNLDPQYKEFMQEYIDLDHMKIVPTNRHGQGKYYIPHQPVIKEASSTTKLRVVFDASCKTSTGQSLNDIMYAGPRLQQDLAEILLRWRLHQVVLTADIEKMYRQIKIHPKDQEYLRILWRFDRTEPIQEYELATVTYGTTAAPYLAIRTLLQLTIDEKKRYPQAAEMASRDFYVDDLLSGTNSIDEAIKLQQELVEMLQAGGFVLRKWSSNHAEVLNQLPLELRDQSLLEIKGDETRKSLGIHWSPTHDNLRFKVVIDKSDKITKRHVLSNIAKIFDPLGWLAPVVIKAKMFIQKLWSQHLDWDDILSDQSKKEWIAFRDQLRTVEDIKLPRWIHYTEGSRLELHGFCDASEKAYGAAIYTKTTNPEGVTTITLLTAKSKVAPVKTKPTIPRLELCAAVLLAKLMTTATEALQNNVESIYAWTDSMIALSWIKGDPTRWKTFVANRVAEIHKLLPSQHWHHVRTEDNPADAISRGIDPSKLKSNHLWWNGPYWLQTEVKIKDLIISPTKEEAKKAISNQCYQTTIKIQEDISQRFSSLTKMQRILALCLKFGHICRTGHRTQQYLTTEELERALLGVIKSTQRATFEREIGSLLHNKPIDNHSKLKNLNPFSDEHEILRVGGRLRQSSLPYNQRHPIIIPNTAHITKLIIWNAHHNTLHGGNQAVLSYIRRKFWIINGKKTVKTYIDRCVTCIRYKAQNAQQLMGELPHSRVNPTPPFFNAGVDYAGPVHLKTTKGKGHRTYKGYIAVFVCFTTKAIHLEVVSDMTTDMFLAAFRRFVSRRGRCAHLYSDNGTNFVGAKTILEKEVRQLLTQSKVQSQILEMGTQWHFIPPSAPHFGGLWEAAVKSMKYHLKRTIGETALTYEELTTLVQQIEACLNSRPLVALPEDGDGPLALTPGHFLVGRELVSPPNPILTDINKSLTGRWRLMQKMKQDFWKIWSSEYLHRLNQRYKWKNLQNNLHQGEVVIIKDDNINPSRWPLARIQEVHPGKDGVVRVVTLKRQGADSIKRPIHKLIPLPIEEDHNLPSTLVNTKPQANQKPTTKRAWRIIIIAILFMAALKQTRAMPYTIHYPQPGLYIEHIGQAQINRGTFRLEIRIGKAQIENTTASIANTTTLMDNLCLQARHLDPAIQCQALTQHLEDKRSQLQLLLKEIPGATRSRQKRGLLGKFLTSVFGVNDEVYQDIDSLDKNQQELIKASSHQTKFMIQALAAFNSTEIRINEHLARFKQKLNQGIDAINKMQSWFKTVDTNRLEIHLLSTYQLAQEYINEATRYYKSIRDLHYNKGHLYDLITPAQVEKIISTATKKLPQNMRILPQPIQRVTITQSTEYIHVYGHLLMAEVTEYVLIKTTPVPLRIEKDAYWTLEVSNDILAIDYDNQLYFQLNEQELIDCITLGDSTHVCSPVAIRQISNSPNCIIDEVYQRTDHTTCNIQKRTLRTTIWKQLYTQNHWMFISSATIRVAITCNGKREDASLNQTGIIQIDQNCIIRTTNTVLTPKQSNSITVVAEFTKPVRINFTDDRVHHKTVISPEPDIGNYDDVIQLQQEEKTFQAEIQDTSWKSVKHYTVAVSLTTSISVILTITTGMVIYRVYGTWRARSASPAPTPVEPATEHQIELEPLYTTVTTSPASIRQPPTVPSRQNV